MLTPGERAHMNLLAERINALEQQVQFLSRHFGIALPVQGPNLDEVAALLKTGDKLGAIKRYRELTKTDLGTAKDAVDQLAVTLGFI